MHELGIAPEMIDLMTEHARCARRRRPDCGSSVGLEKDPRAIEPHPDEFLDFKGPDDENTSLGEQCFRCPPERDIEHLPARHPGRRPAHRQHGGRGRPDGV